MGLVKRMTTPEFFGDFMVEVGQKAHTFSPPALAHLLHALASLVEASHMAVLPPAQQQLLAQRQQRAAAFHARATDAPPPSPQQQQPEQQQHHHAAPQQRQQQQLVLSPPPFLPLTPVTAAAAVAPPHAQHALQHDGEPFTALQPLQQHHAQQQQLHQPPFGPGALQGAPSGGGDAGGSQGLVAAPAREEMAQRRQLAQAAAVLAEHLRPVFPDPSAAHHHQGHTQHSQHAQQQEQPQPRRRGGRAGGGAAAGGGGTSGAASSPSPPSPPPQAPGVRTPTLPAASPLWLQAISARVYAWITAPAAASAATAAAAPPSTAATARAPAPPAIHMEQAGMALRALAMLGHQLDAGRLDAFFAASLPLLKQGTAPSFLYLVQALAVSGYRPRTGDEAARFGEWLQALAQAAARRVYYSPAQVRCAARGCWLTVLPVLSFCAALPGGSLPVCREIETRSSESRWRGVAWVVGCAGVRLCGGAGGAPGGAPAGAGGRAAGGHAAQPAQRAQERVAGAPGAAGRRAARAAAPARVWLCARVWPGGALPLEQH